MKKILQKESVVLRDVAQSVSLSDITSPKIQRIIEEMKIALASQEDGVAIAAPQIGYSLRIFVVSGKVAQIMKRVGKKDEEAEKASRGKDDVYINPIIKKISKERRTVEEGCLSVRFLYGKVSRATKATVEACDEHGKKFSKGGVGLLAQIFQHETDHLNGILFIDKAKYVEEILPENKKPHTN
ncbi:MAG: peptide deformylase [Patescibacteria group bacterium]